MTLEKAIEILNEFPNRYDDLLDLDDIEATKLGIEALKARKVWQDEEGWKPAELLPGETK